MFVLRDVFGFEFAGVACTVGRSEAACRTWPLAGAAWTLP